MRRPIWLLLLCIPTFFLFLGSGAITDSDEAYYAESAREMVESGDWITPRFNYELRFQKPILFYWLIAATYSIAGVSETGARLWAAMSGVGLVFVAYACGRRWIGDDAGFLAGAITATSFAASAMARQSLPDLPLAFFITLSVWSAFEWLATSSRRWLFLSAAASGLAMLTKGPIGIALPVLIVVAALVLQSVVQRRVIWNQFRWRDIALAALVFLVVAAPWYAVVTSIHGTSYLYRFFVAENLDRFATARYNDPRPIWFYLPILVGGLLPWSLFLILWLRRPARGLAESLASVPHITWLVLWAVVPLAVFSVSVGKQPRYILPCLVPLAILLARTITNRIRASGGKRDVLLTAGGIMSGAVFLAVAILLYRSGPIITAAGGRTTLPWAVLVAAAGLGVLIASIFASWRSLPVTIATASASTLLAVHAVLTIPPPQPVVVSADVLTRERRGQTPPCACGAFLRNLPFYLRGRIVPAGTQEEVNAALSDPALAIAAIDVQKLEAAEAALSRRFERIEQTRYLNTALLRLDDFIRPDPDRALQRVVVIRKR